VHIHAQRKRSTELSETASLKRLFERFLERIFAAEMGAAKEIAVFLKPSWLPGRR